MPAEKNDLRFVEPFLLAMAADKDGNTGCQFFITFHEAPCLNNQKHTIIGRLLKGKETIHVIEGIDEYRKVKDTINTQMKRLPGSMGLDVPSGT